MYGIGLHKMWCGSRTPEVQAMLYRKITAIISRQFFSANTVVFLAGVSQTGWEAWKRWDTAIRVSLEQVVRLFCPSALLFRMRGQLSRMPSVVADTAPRTVRAFFFFLVFSHLFPATAIFFRFYLLALRPSYLRTRRAVDGKSQPNNDVLICVLLYIYTRQTDVLVPAILKSRR